MQIKFYLGLLKVLNKILLLEDDSLFAESLIDLLEDYDVTLAKNGQDALDLVYKNRFDLYIFDINVPLINGLNLLKELRFANDNTPTIFLTSYSDKETLKTAFNNGGDDFLSKPVDSEELLLRIKAILRRNATNYYKKCIDLLCHDETQKIFFYDSKELNLSKKEYELLKLLVQNVNKVVTKEIISDRLWSSSDGISEGSIRVYITKIKNLTNLNIENIRGVGYKLISKSTT